MWKKNEMKNRNMVYTARWQGRNNRDIRINWWPDNRGPTVHITGVIM